MVYGEDAGIEWRGLLCCGVTSCVMACAGEGRREEERKGKNGESEVQREDERE